MRAVALALCALVFAIGLMPTAEAASRLCRQLEAQLASVGKSGGKSRRYAAAADNQRRHLARARSQSRNAGCGFLGRGGRQCAGLSATIRRMERNLNELERGSGNGGASRGRILAAIDANGCRDAPRREAKRRDMPRIDALTRDFPNIARILRPSQPIERRAERQQTRADRSFLDQILRGGYPREHSYERRDRDDRQRGYVDLEEPESLTGPFGTFRTMCVRSCDGYFFPMSFNSTTGNFDRDQKGCQVMCPGAEVSLYMHRVPDQESEDMVSMDGAPYTSLPTAFAFQKTGFVRPEGCSCRLQKNFTVIAGQIRPVDPDAENDPPMTPIPAWRPDPAADPETLVNQRTGLSAEMIGRILNARPVIGAQFDERRVRVVGPVFLPDPAAAIDLRAPAQRQIQ